ncbi:MAG TPA: RHS repeat-associated core domain-containing protein [Thermoanaerobaculia bacterium]
MGLAGVNVTGTKFSTLAGKAWFDRVGLEPGSSAATAPEAAPEMIKVRHFSDRLRALATLLAYGRGRTSFRYQSLQSTSSWSAPSASTPAGDSGPSARRYSLYTPELNLLAETELTTAQSPTIACEYVWFGGEPLAQVTTATSEIAWYFNDHLGAPLIQTDATANIVWRVERDPDGTTYTTRAGADRHQPLSLPGQEVTVETETAYNIFRWYRSGWGRYTQAGPIGLSGGQNLYGYVAGNPLRRIDLLGLFCTSDFVKHYFKGKGNIDLAQVGLLSGFISSPSVTAAINNIKQSAMSQAQVLSKQMRGGKCGTETGSFPFTAAQEVDVQNQPCLFSVGGTVVKGNGTCSVTANCNAKTFQLTCSGNLGFNDPFIDALDIGNWWEGNQDVPGGKPYYITGSWSQPISGQGSF